VPTAGLAKLSVDL